MTSRKDVIKNMRASGKTLQEIGDLFGLSRQRVHQIINRDCGDDTEIPDNWFPNPMPVSMTIADSGRDFLREKVRVRDNHSCQICGKRWEDGKRRFDVHHLDEELEGKNGFQYGNNKRIDRMITLCHKCHLNLPHIKEKMKPKKY